MKAPYDVVDETGELLIEKGAEVSVEDFWAALIRLLTKRSV